MSSPQDLFLAYTTATMLTISLTPMRQSILSQISLLGITPDDITEVVLELKRLQKKKPDIYTDTVFEFRRFMDPDRLEERVATLRQRKLRSEAARPRKQVSCERAGFHVLDDPLPPEPSKVDSTLIAEGFRTLANQIGRRVS